jgi:uncharacterized protein (DUF427 family)
MNPHAIVIEKNPNRVKVTFNSKLIADTQKALVLREGKLPPVLYLPREDVDMTLLQRTDHSSHCPFKGDAAYFTINAEGKSAQNAVWTYESPIPAVAGIKARLAFYTEKMDAVEELKI